MLSVVGALCRKSIKMQEETDVDTAIDKGHRRPTSTPICSDAVE